MNEHEMARIINLERSLIGLPVIVPRSKEDMALRRALARIAAEALQDQRNAARTASMVGFLVTRGRTHL